MASVISSGTQTTTVGQSHTLLTNTSSGTYVFHADLSTLQEGDVVEMVVEMRMQPGGEWRRAYGVTVEGPAEDKVSISPVTLAVNGIRCILTQTEGTSRSIPWALVSI